MIYLDYNATTPVLPEVLEAMMPYMTSEWGNPSSTYKFGSKLRTVIEMARAQVAELIGGHAMEIIFTSCGTESNNTAIHAALKANPRKKNIITSMVEHSSVLNYCMSIEKGKEATFWHLISEGKSEKDRLPDLRRCERIRWPRPIIEHYNQPAIKFWVNERRGEKRICLWFEEEEYLVILARRHSYIILWTAYLVTKTHTKIKLGKEYEAYKKLKPPF